VAAVVLAVTVGVSIFFKVDTVVVTGVSKYSAATVVEASQIQPGDSLIFFGRAGAAGRIKRDLPYVDTVRFQLKLPGTVNIIVEEKVLSYALQSSDGNLWMRRCAYDAKLHGIDARGIAQEESAYAVVAKWSAQSVAQFIAKECNAGKVGCVGFGGGFLFA
jgi:hypothetical protein